MLCAIYFQPMHLMMRSQSNQFWNQAVDSAAKEVDLVGRKFQESLDAMDGDAMERVSKRRKTDSKSDSRAPFEWESRLLPLLENKHEGAVPVS